MTAEYRRSRVPELQAVMKLAQDAARTVLKEWELQPDPKLQIEGGIVLPSAELYKAQQVLLACTGKMTELVIEPQGRLQEVSGQFMESRALHICAEHRIADLLDESGEGGLHVEKLGPMVGIDSWKLARILRCLNAIHVFREIGPNVFANNNVSSALVRNEPLRAYMMIYGLHLYSASDWLPSTLTDPTFGPSYDIALTALQPAVGTSKSEWEWLEEKIPEETKDFGRQGYVGALAAEAGSSTNGNTNGTNLNPAGYTNGDNVNNGTNGTSRTNGSTESANGTNGTSHAVNRKTKPRPELALFGLAMQGGGKVHGTAHLYDYPWESLGEAILVDVAGGVGGFGLQLTKLYPKLQYTVQDRPDVVKQGHGVWMKENPDAIAQGQVKLTPHDMFSPQPIVGADVYWLRYIIHDWSDDYCVQILSALAPAMRENSRVLIADQVMNTTFGDPQIPSAPSPLPANYGYHKRYSHQRDLVMMASLNGIERTPAQLDSIVTRAGLKIAKIWECRSQVGIVECRLA
ncbi:MAG: hypothetical protein M1819_002066 [Sarea resinae]|nr:MAG: hypothetical protein M1819_002066 [Sarea resinae]